MALDGFAVTRGQTARLCRVGGRRERCERRVRRRGADDARMTHRETRRFPGGFVALGDRLRTRASARERFRLEVFLRRGVRPRSVLPRPPAPRANLEAFRDAHRVRLAVDVAVEEPSGHRPFALDPVDLRQRERGDGRLDATHRHEVRVRGGYRQVHVSATQKVQEGDHAVPRHAVEPAHLEMQNVGILRGGERASQDVALRPHVQVCDVDPIHGVARPTGPLPTSTGPGCLRADLCRCRENTPRKWSPRKQQRRRVARDSLPSSERTDTEGEDTQRVVRLDSPAHAPAPRDRHASRTRRRRGCVSPSPARAARRLRRPAASRAGRAPTASVRRHSHEARARGVAANARASPRRARPLPRPRPRSARRRTPKTGAGTTTRSART